MKDDNGVPAKNVCPHCKQFQHKKPHHIDPGKCMWNKKCKRYCFRSICDKLKVTFKPCHKIMVELGGYTDKRIWRANDGVWGQRMLRERMIRMDGSRLNGRAVIRTK